MTRRDWLILVLLCLGIQGLHLGIWWWGYTASDTIPLDKSQPGTALLIACVEFVVGAVALYFATLSTLRRSPNSRLLGYGWLFAILLPTVGFAVWAHLGGPRFSPLMLQFPTLGCHMGWLLGSAYWRLRQSRAE